MDRLAAALPRCETADALSCIADVRLSLGAGGLFWVLGLARSVPVWLVQAHWAMVEDPFYLQEKALVRCLAGRPNATAEDCRAAVLDTCDTWRKAQREWCLESHPNLYWSAERSFEAVLPKDGGRGLTDLCDALAAGLDHRLGRSAETVDALADCARDALALAAALGGTRPIVLMTTLEGDESEPALARSLDEADIPCRRLGADGWADRFNARLAPVLVHAGLAVPLAAGTLRLAGLQVVAPRALMSAAEEDDGDSDRLAWNAAEDGNEARLWDGAAAVCWEVQCAA